MICQILYHDIGLHHRGRAGRYAFDILATLSCIWVLAEALGKDSLSLLDYTR